MANTTNKKKKSRPESRTARNRHAGAEKRKAELEKLEAQQSEAKQLVERNTVKVVIGSALVFAVALSAAYYFGSRAGAKAARRKR